MGASESPAVVIHTIGHSTRRVDDFLGLLEEHAVGMVADVRTMPRSRFNPQFNGDVLAASLAFAGIEYLHLSELGGFRKAKIDSENIGWRNASFRGYADYMLTDEFQSVLNHLIELATERRVAIMCAEAVPWRCHRLLIADALTVRGHHVEHIIGVSGSRPHVLTSFARVKYDRLTYPSG